VACKVTEYGWPTCADPNPVVVMVSGWGPAAAIVMLSDCWADSAPESATLAVKGKEPDCVGVPLICPEDAARLKPGGKEPEATLQLYGGVPPAAVNVAW